MGNKRASIGKIIFVDYIVFQFAAMAIVGAGFYVYNTFLIANPIPGLNLMMLGAIVVGLAGLVWRGISVYSIINNGREIKAIINEINYYRGSGFIKYTYPRDGKALIGKATVMKTGTTSQLKVGQEVTIATLHGKSLIKDLFV